MNVTVHDPSKNSFETRCVSTKNKKISPVRYAEQQRHSEPLSNVTTDTHNASKDINIYTVIKNRYQKPGVFLPAYVCDGKSLYVHCIRKHVSNNVLLHT
jgi:hypothetical protein